MIASLAQTLQVAPMLTTSRSGPLVQVLDEIQTHSDNFKSHMKWLAKKRSPPPPPVAWPLLAWPGIFCDAGVQSVPRKILFQQVAPPLFPRAFLKSVSQVEAPCSVALLKTLSAWSMISRAARFVRGGAAEDLLEEQEEEEELGTPSACRGQLHGAAKLRTASGPAASGSGRRLSVEAKDQVPAVTTCPINQPAQQRAEPAC